MVRRRRRLASPVMPLPAPAPPLDNDDLLREILLLLPPQPSSLLRASVVCKRWRRLVSDPRFLRRFRAHHRRPPLLGCFYFDLDIGYVFTPTLDPPDRVPASRFSLPQRCRDERLDFVECRHGLALFLNKKQPEAVVWNPISGHQHRVAFPSEFDNSRERDILFAAVLCAAGDDDPGHVHGDCDLSSFKLALVRGDQDHTSVSVCLYKYKPGLWGNVISTTKDWYTVFHWRKPSVLVGNALYWWCCHVIEGDILVFDFEMDKLVAIEKPVDHRCSDFQIMRTEESSLGLVMLTELTMQLWERKVNSDDVVTWVLQKTIELTKHLWPRQSIQVFWTRIQGYDEDHNVIFLGTSSGSFMIQLKLMQFDDRFQFKSIFNYFPYTSFYAADWAAGGRDDGPEMSSSTSPNCPIR